METLLDLTPFYAERDALIAKIKAAESALLQICDGSNWPEYAQSGDGYRAYGEITEQLHDIASELRS